MAEVYWLMVGLLMEEYRRIYYNYDLDRRGIEAIDIDSSSLIDLALKWGGVRSANYAGLSETFITMAESQLPADEVRKRVGEYVCEALGPGPGISPN